MNRQLIISDKDFSFTDLDVEDILNAIEQSAGDVSASIALPPELYTSERWFDFERSAIWDKEWICVGHSSLIPNVGDYFSITLIDDPLLIVRDSEGEIRALSAVCQHRGHLLGGENGNVRHFSCPFHAWSYDLTGRLVTAPEMAAHIKLDELRSSHSLPGLKVNQWNGFVFICFSESPPPLGERLKRLSEEIKNHGVDGLVATPTIDWEDQLWNWKFMHENAIEPYHTSYLHQKVHEFAPSTRATFVEWLEDDDGAIYHPTGFNYLDGNFTPNFRSLFPVIDTLSEAERQRVMFACVMPNLFFAAVPDGVLYYLVLPKGANNFTIRVGFLYPRSTLELPTFEATFPSVVAGLELFNNQDVDANLSAHRGLKSRFAQRGRYAPKEETLPQLNKWLLKRYRQYAVEEDLVPR
jgi:phenylpropionate dioxygenase-like ring-hydroxylating dioxygenase large terminal subunit